MAKAYVSLKSKSTESFDLISLEDSMSSISTNSSQPNFNFDFTTLSGLNRGKKNIKSESQCLFEVINYLDGQLMENDVSPIYLVSKSKLEKQLNLWKTELPMIDPFYAVKCNPTPAFVNMLLENGVGFDCASLGEISNVLSIADNTADFVKNKIIYANPIKQMGHIKQAMNLGVNLTTIDSIEEAEKLSSVARANNNTPMDVLIRITTDDSSSQCPLSTKFGVDIDSVNDIILKCKTLNVQVKGVAFHVGSGFKDTKTLQKAVRDAKIVWGVAEQYGMKPSILDVGGGFGYDVLEFKNAASVLRKELNFSFGEQMVNGKVKIISELGRFLAGPCFSLIINVTGTRKMGLKKRVYMNDGLYGGLNCILYDHQEISLEQVTSNGRWVYNNQHSSEQETEYSIWGPTCDGLDCIISSCRLQHDISVGDWMLIKNAGAYTTAAATGFNGFKSEFGCLLVE
ncbi:ornithine decarboxylase [Martiniozyma asiatica (nom. inval.)]|nr:ornithine decarboxylase [Martiniozyma asiatica]